LAARETGIGGSGKRAADGRPYIALSNAVSGLRTKGRPLAARETGIGGSGKRAADV